MLRQTLYRVSTSLSDADKRPLCHCVVVLEPVSILEQTGAAFAQCACMEGRVQWRHLYNEEDEDTNEDPLGRPVVHSSVRRYLLMPSG